MTLVFANNAGTTLAAIATLSDTSLVLAPGEGARFPNPAVGESFIVTLQDALLFEIVECTARATDTLTVVRARESTAAQTWGIGTTVTMRPTAGTMAAFEQRTRALAEFAPINGPITLNADPADGTKATRRSWVESQIAATTASLTSLINDKGRIVGEVVEYHGLTLPPKFVWAAGQTLSRATYAALFEVLTRELITTVTNGSPTVTVTSGSTDDIVAGMMWSQSGYFPAFTTVVSKTVNTVTFSANATASGSGIAGRICPHGIGNNTTNFRNVDRRGNLALGRDDLGGTAANRVTVAGSTVNGLLVGFLGGDQLLQQHTHVISQTPHAHTASDTIAFTLPDGVMSFLFGPLTSTYTGPGGGTLQNATGQSIPKTGSVTVNANTANVTNDNTGSGTAQNMPPVSVCNYIIYTGV